MTYKFRNILFAFFVLVFFVLTAIFSLSASGYKVSLTALLNGKSFIQKTGILAVDSTPGGAKISIVKEFNSIFSDEEVLENKKITTPYKIRNLLPGDYNLSFELEGYWPWQQRVSIYSGQTTYIEDVVLFRKNLPVIFFNSGVQDIAIDSYGQNIALETDNKAINLNTDQEIDLTTDVYSLNFLGNKKILVNGDSIFDYSKNKYISLGDIDLGNSQKVKIKNGDLYYLNNGLHSYDFLTKKDEYIFNDKRIVDYDFYNNNYYYIFSGLESYSFKVYSYRQKQLIQEISLPISGDYEILEQTGSSNFVYIYDHKFKTLYIFSLLSKFNSYWAVLNNIDNINFIDNNNFIYSSGMEIYSYNSILAEEFLIGRFESQITGLLWHPKNYLIYSTEHDIVILDLKYNKYSIKLVSLDKVGNLALDKLGSVLYFTGKVGNQEGVYKLLIQ